MTSRCSARSRAFGRFPCHRHSCIRQDGGKTYLGINIREGEHYTQFLVYDLDGDGRAEIACKTADGTKDAGSSKLGRVLTGPRPTKRFHPTQAGRPCACCRRRDGDGKDEIAYQGMTIDHKFLYGRIMKIPPLLTHFATPSGTQRRSNRGPHESLTAISWVASL